MTDSEVLVIPATVSLFPKQVCSAEECRESLLWQPKSLGSSYQEACSIYEHVLNSCCRNQPSKRIWEMPWAPRSTPVISFISFSPTGLHLSDPFFAFSPCVCLPHFFATTILACCFLSVSFSYDGTNVSLLFLLLQFFSLIKGMADCCAFNTHFLERKEKKKKPTQKNPTKPKIPNKKPCLATNSQFLEKYIYNMASKSWAFVSFSLCF